MNFSHQKQVHAQTLLLAGLGRNLLVAREDRNFLCGHQTTCSRDAEQRVLGTHVQMGLLGSAGAMVGGEGRLARITNSPGSCKNLIADPWVVASFLYPRLRP
jgi:hypothetical protein